MSGLCEPREDISELTWLLLDDLASDEQVRRLEALLTASEEARRTYIACVQLHADLHGMLCDVNLHKDVLELIRDAQNASGPTARGAEPPLETPAISDADQGET